MSEIIFDYGKWNTQLFNTSYYDFLLNKEPLDNGIYSLQLDGAKLDILIQDIHNTLSKYCLVVFGGALSLEKGKPPFFSGSNLARQLKVPLIAVLN